MNIHIFNPEHDIALAANNRFWTAPHAGRQLRADLGWLPALWAEDGDVVVVDDVAQAENALRKLNRTTAADVRLMTLGGLAKLAKEDLHGAKVLPWGWDVSIAQQLRRAGIPAELLPQDEALERLRTLSSRETSSRMLRDLCQHFTDCIGEAKVVRSVAELEDAIDEWKEIVLKSPWSSSGRGVRYMDQRPNNIIMWAEKIIKTQGFIMVEQKLDKVADFGMEFSVMEDGGVRYDGLSLFETSAGAYTGSILDTEDEKMNELTRFLSKDLLVDVQTFICSWIKNEFDGTYVGPFGIDMMICKSADGRLMLDPCVEINLRRTMGHVALALSPKSAGERMLMRVTYEGTNYHFRIVNAHELLY